MESCENQNPKIKKGDVIIVKVARSGIPQSWVGIPLTVENVCGNYCRVMGDIEYPRDYNVYITGSNADVIILADRKLQAEALKNRVVGLERTINNLKRDIEILEKFDSDEEYTAYKIETLLKAKGVKAKTQILKELKETHLI